MNAQWQKQYSKLRRNEVNILPNQDESRSVANQDQTAAVAVAYLAPTLASHAHVHNTHTPYLLRALVLSTLYITLSSASNGIEYTVHQGVKNIGKFELLHCNTCIESHYFLQEIPSSEFIPFFFFKDSRTESTFLYSLHPAVHSTHTPYLHRTLV